MFYVTKPFNSNQSLISGFVIGLMVLSDMPCTLIVFLPIGWIVNIRYVTHDQRVRQRYWAGLIMGSTVSFIGLLVTL